MTVPHPDPDVTMTQTLPMRAPSSLSRSLVTIAAVALLYYLGARLGLQLQLPGTNASPVWPPSGIGLCAILLFGPRIWPGIAAGAFLANLLTLPGGVAALGASVAIAVGNTLEHVVAYVVISRTLGKRRLLEQSGDVIRFLLTAALGCAVAATVGATSLLLFGIVPATLAVPVWITWWLGDLTGMLILSPAILRVWHDPRPRMTPAGAIELGALLAVTCVATAVLFGGRLPFDAAPSLSYLPVPCLIWAAFRFGQRETSLAALAIGVIAVAATWSVMHDADGLVAGRTPFAGGVLSANDTLLILQGFVCSIAVIGESLATALADQRRTRELYRDLYDHAPDLHVSINAETGRIEQVNLTACNALGRSREDLIGRSALEVYHPSCHESVRRAFAEFHETGRMKDAELLLVRADGSTIDVTLNSTAVYDDAGHIVRSRSVWRDVTALKRMSAATAHLAAIVETSDDAIVSNTLDGIVTSWNEGAEHLYGWRSGEVLGRHLSRLVPDERREEVEKILEAVRSGQRSSLESLHRRRDGSPVAVSLTVSPIRERGGARTGASIIARDITERRRAEAEIARYAAELERSNEELDRFAHAASHDLRAPLRGIHDLASWIDDEAGDRLSDESRADLQLLISRVERMQTLLTDLLEYARVGRLDEVIGDVDTRALAGSVADLLAPPEGFRVEIGELPTIPTHEAPLQQVLRNLIGNAIKHHDRPPGTVHVSGRLEKGHAVFVVEDDGPGIPPEHGEDVFELFRSLGPRDEIGGSGMGLALVKKIVESRGGRIRLSSDGKRGTRFAFTWPLDATVVSSDDRVRTEA